MEAAAKKSRFTFYLQIGCAYLLIWLLLELPNYRGVPVARTLNNFWLVLYIVAINYLFFDHVFPALVRLRKGHLIAVLSSLIALFILLFLQSFGLYAWRLFGIGLHIYTVLRTFTSITSGALNMAQHGFSSIVFFGIARHVFDHLRLKKIVTEMQLRPGTNAVTEQNQPDHLFLTVKKKKVKVVFSTIVYIESKKEYVRIVNDNGELTVKMRTSEIEQLLPDGLFRRIHRSFIISLNKIESHTADTVNVGGRSIPIGRGYKEIAGELWQ